MEDIMSWISRCLVSSPVKLRIYRICSTRSPNSYMKHRWEILICLTKFPEQTTIQTIVVNKISKGFYPRLKIKSDKKLTFTTKIPPLLHFTLTIMRSIHNLENHYIKWVNKTYLLQSILKHIVFTNQSRN